MTDDDVTPTDPLAAVRALEALRDPAGEEPPGQPAEGSPEPPAPRDSPSRSP